MALLGDETRSQRRKQYFRSEGAVLGVPADVPAQTLHNGVHAHQPQAVARSLGAAEKFSHLGQFFPAVKLVMEI